MEEVISKTTANKKALIKLIRAFLLCFESEITQQQLLFLQQLQLSLQALF